MPVPIFLHVALTTKTSFTQGKDVGNRGVGSVERSIVDNTTTPLQVKNYRQQKTIMMPFVVDKNKDLQKIPIVEGGAQVIVGNVGRKLFLHQLPLVALIAEYFYLELQDD